MRKLWLSGLVVTFGLTAGLALSKDRPEDAERRAAFERNAKPGPEHELLAKIVGSYEARMVLREADKRETKAIGQSVYELAYGGLFVRQTYESSIPLREGGEKKFEGTAIYGYDKVKKKFVCVWYESLASGIYHCEGTASGNVITFLGESADPVSGELKRVRSVLAIEDENRHTFMMYEPSKSGPESPTLEVTFIRKK